MRTFGGFTKADDFFYGEPQAVPEPSTIAMLALAGLGYLGFRLRRVGRICPQRVGP